MALRSVLIVRAHSATVDTGYHVSNGLQLLHHIRMQDVQLDNPPTGSALATLPVFLFRAVGVNFGLHGWLEVIAVWKSLLAMPIFIIGYFWARNLYGNGAGLLALTLLQVEPTLCAHIAYATNDTVSLAGMAVMLWLCMRYIRLPSWKNFLSAVVATGVALAIKQNAVFAAAAVASIAVVTWVVLPRMSRRSGDAQPKIASEVRRIRYQFVLCVPLLFLVIWACVLFRWDPFFERLPTHAVRLPFAWILLKPWPAGLYVQSVLQMFAHARNGHAAFLFGHYNKRGWWYYFPVLATYKVPLAMGFLFLLALFQWRKPRKSEVPLLLCIFWFAVMCLISTIDIGFRHALPLVFVVIIFASRTWTGWRSIQGWVVAVAALMSFVEMARVFPNEVSYINYPRDKVWLQISDSNIDWGQGLIQARHWADAHARPGVPVYILYWAWVSQLDTLDPRATVDTEAGPNLHVVPLNRRDLPESGILIVSPVLLTGQYMDEPLVPELYDQQPTTIIGNSLLVYDLDDLKRRGLKLWASTKRPASEPSSN